MIGKRKLKLQPLVKTDFEKHYPKRWRFFFSLLLAFFWTFWLGMLIYTSWYENDLALTKGFGDLGFYNPVLRGLGGYMVSDGYFSLTAFIMPTFILIIEALTMYLKKFYPNNKFANFCWRNRKYLQYLLLIIYVIINIDTAHRRFISDRGFGKGFDAFLGWEYTIPVGIIIFLYNNTLSWVLGWYVMYHLGKRPDFLANKYWKRSLFMLLYMAIAYILVYFLKQGLGRPLYATVRWGDYMEYLEETNFPRWEYFMTHNNIRRFGWEMPGHLYDEINHPEYINTAWDNAPGQDWPWWRPTQMGFFFTNQPKFEGNPYNDRGFPSGHLVTCTGIIVSSFIFTPSTKNHIFSSKWRLFGFIYGLIYFVLMFVGMGLIYAHWMSDFAFTIVWLFPSYYLASKLNDLICDKWLLKLHQKWQTRHQNHLNEVVAMKEEE